MSDGQRHDLQTRLLERAMKDDAFRQRLLRDPKSVVTSEMRAMTGADYTFPDGVELRVVEETPTTLYLVLPSAEPRPDGPLSDEELDTVAGGLGPKSVVRQLGGCMPLTGQC